MSTLITPELVDLELAAPDRGAATRSLAERLVGIAGVMYFIGSTAFTMLVPMSPTRSRSQ